MNWRACVGEGPRKGHLRWVKPGSAVGSCSPSVKELVGCCLFFFQALGAKLVLTPAPLAMKGAIKKAEDIKVGVCVH